MTLARNKQKQQGKAANINKRLTYDFSIDAEWFDRSHDNINPSKLLELTKLQHKWSKIHFIALGIHDWQTDRKIFYEHQDYGAGYVDCIWRGLPSVCELIDARPLSEKPWGVKPIPLIVKLHFYYSPADIWSFLADENLFHSICNYLTRKKTIETQYSGMKDSPVDRQGNIAIPWYVEKGRQIYQIKLNFIDYCGLVANASYAKTCASYGVKLENKTLMDKYKSCMNLPYNDPDLRDKFIDYTLGDINHKDLYYAALNANNNIRKNVFNIKKLTNLITRKGGETAKLFLDVLTDEFKQLDKADIEHLAEYTRAGNKKTANNLQKLIQPSSVKGIVDGSLKALTGQFLAVVYGGRCRNEMPHQSTVKSPIISMDLKSCYGQALKFGVFPIGYPVVWEDDNRRPEKWLTIKEVWNKWGDELVPECWSGVIDTGGYLLPFNQSLFISNDIKKVELKTDIDGDETVNVDGQIGIYLNEIRNGVITEHSYQTAKAVMSQKEWGQFIRTVRVKALIFHPRSLMCDTEQELIEKHQQHTEQDYKVTIDKRFGKIINDNRCHYWINYPLSKFVNPLLEKRATLKKERNKYKKDTDKYFELNSAQELLKLTVNATFGTIASQYFDISNVITANNITDRARCACFIMASITNGLTSITDGSESPLMEFLFFNKGTSMGTLTGLRHGLIDWHTKKHIDVKPLGGLDWEKLKLTKNPEGNFQIEFPNGNIYKGGKQNESWDFIAELYEKHIKDFFDNCSLTPDWVNQFQYEDKGIFQGITVQGASNYYLEKYLVDREDNKPAKIKIRGSSLNKTYYSTKPGNYYQEIPAPMKQVIEDVYNEKPLTTYQEGQVTQIQAIDEWNKKNQERQTSYPIMPGEGTSRTIRAFPVKSSCFHYRTIEHRRVVKRLETLLEQYHLKGKGQGLGALYASEGKYNYQQTCAKIQRDLLNMSIEEFKKYYKIKAELVLNQKLPRLFR